MQRSPTKHRNLAQIGPLARTKVAAFWQFVLGSPSVYVQPLTVSAEQHYFVLAKSEQNMDIQKVPKCG